MKHKVDPLINEIDSYFDRQLEEAIDRTLDIGSAILYDLFPCHNPFDCGCAAKARKTGLPFCKRPAWVHLGPRGKPILSPQVVVVLQQLHSINDIKSVINECLIEWNQLLEKENPDNWLYCNDDHEYKSIYYQILDGRTQ